MPITNTNLILYHVMNAIYCSKTGLKNKCLQAKFHEKQALLRSMKSNDQDNCTLHFTFYFVQPSKSKINKLAW